MWLDLVGLVMCMAPALGLLACKRALDQRALGGETFLAIDVRGPAPWRRGHVRLTTPIGYEGLIGAAAPTVFDRLPAHYDVIIHCGGGA